MDGTGALEDAGTELANGRERGQNRVNKATAIIGAKRDSVLVNGEYLVVGQRNGHGAELCVNLGDDG